MPGTKHDAISLIVEGRKVATTRFSRGHAELSDSILTIILLHMPAPHRTDDETTPRTPEEIELVRNLLRGLRRFERAGVFIEHEWCRVRRSPRADSETMMIENLGSRRFADH